jgi:uncharacterized membrane protein YGL010W
MSRISELLEKYGESHRNSVNKRIHWICVPAIMISLIGLLWTVPFPVPESSVTSLNLPVNWATLFILLAMIYYFRLSVIIALGMLMVTAILIGFGYIIATQIPLPLWQSCLIIFILAWVGQFWGHRIEGKKPSFVEDVQFLLIGPVWLLAHLYRRWRIRY